VVRVAILSKQYFLTIHEQEQINKDPIVRVNTPDNPFLVCNMGLGLFGKILIQLVHRCPSLFPMLANSIALLFEVVFPIALRLET
jgi:hypothetical protein